MPEDWIVNRTSTPGIMWARYAAAIGDDAIKLWFGQHWPPPHQRPGEEVFVWRDRDLSPRPFDPAGHPAAWLSLALDQFDPSIAWMSRGVWPDWHGRGLGKAMRAWAEDWCQGKGATSLNVIISAVNAEHLANAIADPYWQMDRVLFKPPSFGFTHRLSESIKIQTLKLEGPP